MRYKKYEKSLYDQIVHAKTSSQFSKAVRYLLTSVLFKIKLPREVREEFINDIAELFTQKFGYSGTTDDPLFEKLSELYMLEDVKAIRENGKYTGGVTLNCKKLEYSFDSMRQGETLRRKPFDIVAPYGEIFEFNNSSIIDQIMWDGGVKGREDFLDVKLAADKAGLTDHQRDLIWLNGIVGLSVREIADLGSPYPSKSIVATRLREAKNLLIKASQEN